MEGAIINLIESVVATYQYVINYAIGYYANQNEADRYTADLHLTINP